MEATPVLMKDSNGDRTDEIRCRFLAVVGPELRFQKKVEVTQVVQLGVFDPHSREDMQHVLEIALNGVLVDRCAACIQSTHVDAVREDLGIGYQVLDNREIFCKGETGADLEPLFLRGGSGLGSGGYEIVMLGPLCSALVIV